MKLAAAAKTIVIALLAITLLVPVLMIHGLVAERQARSNEAIAGIAESWGKRQTVAAPYLAVPYERHWTEIRRETSNGKLREIRYERSESRVLRLPATSIDWNVGAEISEKKHQPLQVGRTAACALAGGGLLAARRLAASLRLARARHARHARDGLVRGHGASETYVTDRS
jgi:Inner membrane protein CreD